MTAFIGPVLWCVIQATLLACLGVAATRLLGRRAPGAAATAGAAAAATILGVTLLIPVRLPSFSLGNWAPSGGEFASLDDAELGGGAAARRTGEVLGGGADLGLLARRLWGVVGGGGGAKPQAAGSAAFFLAALVAGGAVLGLMRVVVAWRHVMQLRRGRRPIADAALLSLAAELSRQLGIRRPVELSESAEIAGPAVVGWRRPVVLLPVERADWNGEQLRAALAHELAHVAQGDFFWRVAASVATAVHFYHPLVHWLARRLALMQELAADRLAAAALGGAGGYLRALSELAVRLDEQPRFRAEPIVLPAFSSNLIRRITMLRSTEGTDFVSRGRFSGVAFAGLIALTGVATVAVRGAAERVDTPTENRATEGALFARPATESALLGSGEQGAFVVRVGELARVPAFAQAFPLFNRMIHEQLTQQFGVPRQEIPEIHLEAIEWFAGAPSLNIKPKTGPEKGQEGQITFDCDGFIVRFRDKVDWKSWLFKALPGTEEVEALRGEEFNYLVLPSLNGDTVFGTQQFLVAARDERTLVLSTDAEQLRELVRSNGAEANASIGAEWKSLDGGLATLMAKIDAKSPLGLPDEPGAQMAISILEKARQFGVAFDTNPATGEAQFRVTLTAADQAGAEQVKAALEGLLPLMVAQLGADRNLPTRLEDKDDPHRRVQTLGDANTDREVGEFWLAMLKSCTPRLAPQADGTVQVQMTATARLPQQVVVAYEYVTKAPAEPQVR